MTLPLASRCPACGSHQPGVHNPRCAGMRSPAMAGLPRPVRPVFAIAGDDDGLPMRLGIRMVPG